MLQPTSRQEPWNYSYQSVLSLSLNSLYCIALLLPQKAVAEGIKYLVSEVYTLRRQTVSRLSKSNKERRGAGFSYYMVYWQIPVWSC